MSDLTWGLCVCTYKRASVLLRCLKLALEQSRPPTEVVVVDASEDWAETRELVESQLGRLVSGVRWTYVQANRKSLPAQRNQGLTLATSDVVFLIDDDSLMFPSCAEQIMNVYETDVDKIVQGVGASVDALIPDDPATVDTGDSYKAEQCGLLRYLHQLAERQLYLEKHFVSYEVTYPSHNLPLEVRRLKVLPVRLFNGMQMTFRREAISAVGFEEPHTREDKRVRRLE